MSRRTIISFITILLLALLVFASQKEIIHAWKLMSNANMAILIFLIPLQILTYYAVGEMMFSYLRAKGSLKNVSRTTLTRMALELNFVNHLLPSGGVSGVSYMTWRFGHLQVSPAKATMAQLVRYIIGFIAYLILLFVAVIVITLDTGADRMIILSTSVMTCTIVFLILFSLYIISDTVRLRKFAHWVTRAINRIFSFLSRRKRIVVTYERVEHFLIEFRNDYRELMRDKRVLLKPLLWGLIFNIADTTMFLVGFWALGYNVNPAAIIIAYGVASFAGFLIFTPGGAGAYEAIMISVLSASGAPREASIAAVVLVRVILLLGTIVTGYIFYQLTVMKYGKSPLKR